MKKISTTGMFALVALAASAITVNAQQAPAAGRGGRGGRGPAPYYGSKEAPTSPVSGNAANGKKLYYQYACYSCHGYTGETGARPFVNHWTSNLATEQNFLNFLRGRADAHPARPSTSMPNFAANTIADAQLKDIYAYIRTFKSHAPATTPPALAEILKSADKPYKGQ